MKNNQTLGAIVHKIAPSLKLPLFMRISLILLFSVVLQLSAANVFGQRMRQPIAMRNVTLGEVLSRIEQVSDYVFLYNNKTINSNRIVSVESSSKEIPVVLDKLFRNTDITYTVVNKQIILSTSHKEKKESRQQPQQTKNIIKGTVVDTKGEPLIGVNVKVKGSAVGVITDVDGQFSLQASNSEQLEFSYVGYTSKVLKASSGMKVALQEDNKVLNEVVVTALGIKRQTKALGYSVQELKGVSLTEARESNLMNSLSGKIAGVQVSGSGNGAMGSSRIIIRGNNSLGGNNEPLVVVDGVPINNFNGGTSNSEWGGSDSGNGLSDLDPDDIESISILKGAAAAALYGTRAGNGVLMVTTKKGSHHQKGLGITFNSNVQFENAMIKPEMQNQYGQGTNGSFDADGNYSWGPKMEGQQLTDWTGQTRAFKPYDNSITDYLQTGLTATNTLGASLSSDKYSFFGTISYQRINGVVPHNNQNKYVLNLRNAVNLSSKLSLDIKVNYIKQKMQNLPALTADPTSVMANYLMMPRSVHFSDLENPLNEDGTIKQWTSKETNYVLNPYFTALNKNQNHRDRFIGFVSINYKPMSWMNIMLRHGEDIYWSGNENRTCAATPYATDYKGHGNYYIGSSNFRESNTDALVTFAKDNWWSSKFSGSLSVGGNLMYTKTETMGENSGPLAIPDFFSISNGQNQTMTHYTNEKAVNSVYGLAQLNYGNWIYLDLTARNDWSSTLPKKNRSFFYPSVGIGWVVSDMLGSYNINFPKWISFAKLRASYAEVGNDTDPYRLTTTYAIFNVTSDIKGSEVNNTIPLSNLKPENIKSTEFGLDLRFLNSRLNLDFTWYQKKATNQILTLPISSTTGKSYRLINAGNIENKGVEFVVNAIPVRVNKFEWDITLNYSKNTNKIKKLHPDLSTYELASTSFVKVVAREGGRYGDIVGYRYKRDATNKIVVDGDGLPMLESNMDTDHPIGNYLPKWTGSLTNLFMYKNFSLSFMLDIRVGGDIYMNSLARGSEYGTTKMSLSGRDEWYSGKGGIIVDGVTEAGKINTTAVNPQEYWSRVSRAGEKFIYSGTNLRLRELTFGYTFPKSVLSKTPFTNLKCSFVGRNLWLIKKSIPGYDPECSYSTGNGQGIEYASFPSMRSLGFNINVSF